MTVHYEEMVSYAFRDRFDCSYSDYDEMLRHWGGASPEGRPRALEKALRAARGKQGDGTLVAVAKAFLAGRWSAQE